MSRAILPEDRTTGPLTLLLTGNYIVDERSGQTGAAARFPWPSQVHVEGMRVVLRDDGIHIETATEEQLAFVRGERAPKP